MTLYTTSKYIEMVRIDILLLFQSWWKCSQPSLFNPYVPQLWVCNTLHWLRWGLLPVYSIKTYDCYYKNTLSVFHASHEIIIWLLFFGFTFDLSVLNYPGKPGINPTLPGWAILVFYVFWISLDRTSWRIIPSISTMDISQ